MCSHVQNRRLYQFSLSSNPVLLDLLPSLLMLLSTLQQRLHRRTHAQINTMHPAATSGIYHHVATNVSKVYLGEGLAVQGGVGLLQPHALLLVLLQSQRVDGEEGHVGLEHKHRKRKGLISNKKFFKYFKFLVFNIQHHRHPVR